MQLFTLPKKNALDFLSFVNFFPNGIKLCNANHVFKFILQKSIDLFSLAKHYSQWMIQVYEMVHSEMITMRKELKQWKEFFEVCKKHSKNRKIVLQSEFVFMTEEMLQITKETKFINVTKSA